MWMSNCLIVVNRINDDANGLLDIAAAVREMGAVVTVDEQQQVIEAALPAHDVPTLQLIPGVSYVRCVFSYFCGTAPRAA
jgi:hypothetical protein